MDRTATLMPAALAPQLLYRRANLSAMHFETTADIEAVEGIIGQERAVEAVRFGSRIDKPGFNLFVIGAPEARMRPTVQAMLKRQAAAEDPPCDWVYVNNFTEPHKPVAIALPAGRAPHFRDAMQELIEDLRVALPVAFESEDYQTLRGSIDDAFQKKQAEAFAELGTKAQTRGLVLIRTPMGFALAPAQDGKVVSPDEFNAWNETKKQEVQEATRELEKELERVVRLLPSWEKERRDEVRKLDRDIAARAVSQSIDETKAGFQDIPAILEHLDAVQADLIENVPIFIGRARDEEMFAMDPALGAPFSRYEVNVLVTCEDATCGAPIVEELHPTLGNLIGRIEYMARQGALVTNFRLIKPGAVHRANGGYLLLDARSLLTEALSWAALKRMLKQRRIVIEEPSRLIGLGSTVTLEPDPIPLGVKIVLFGDRLLYYLLSAFDPELREHFKVLADFEDDIDRGEESEAAMARLLAALVNDEGLLPIEREGVALLIEHAARMADDAGKLTLLADRLRDLVIEADFRAREAGHAATSRDDIGHALDERERRASRLRDRSQEAIMKNLALIDTDGARIGQINGLSVLDVGGYRFGKPTRITARVRPGGGRVVDIEREARLGGPIHSKGVLILSGFLAGHFALDGPMSLYASVVFEQSYGGVEGDSASSAELYALLSALADVPLRQDIAVTGSVNQHGQVQAIGGVNEKIEGFFDLCRERGLTGTQGVAIPEANVQHLMLREDVVESCAQGRFAVYPIRTIDEGITLLTGHPAGERDYAGHYPDGTINNLVETKLQLYAETLRRFGKHDAGLNSEVHKDEMP
ncbi:Lon protease family protein [Aquamicrobium defluvii]|nr:ATP-binding protein [Aquamicrobium defluvii]